MKKPAIQSNRKGGAKAAQPEPRTIDAEMNITAIAGFLGVPHATTRDILVSAGLPSTGKIPTHPAVRCVLAHFREKATRIDAERLGAQRRREESHAAMAEMERGKMAGTLVLRDDYDNNYRDAIAKAVARISRMKGLNERQKEDVFAEIRAVKLAPLME